jgi:hypothetical protein
MQLTRENSGPRIRLPRFGATTDAPPRTAAATAHAVRPAAEKGTTATMIRTETETGIVTVVIVTVVIVTEEIVTEEIVTVIVVTVIVTATERGAGGAGPRRRGGARLPNVGGKTGPGLPLRRTTRRIWKGIGRGKGRGIVRRRLLMNTEFHTLCPSDGILFAGRFLCFFFPKKMGVVHDVVASSCL